MTKVAGRYNVVPGTSVVSERRRLERHGSAALRAVSGRPTAERQQPTSCGSCGARHNGDLAIVLCLHVSPTHASVPWASLRTPHAGIAVTKVIATPHGTFAVPTNVAPRCGPPPTTSIKHGWCDAARIDCCVFRRGDSRIPSHARGVARMSSARACQWAVALAQPCSAWR